MHEAFQILNEALTTAPVVAYQDFAKTFSVATDDLSKAIRAALSHKDDSKRKRPLHYASPGLNNAGRHYLNCEREELAKGFALKNFTFYARG